MENHLLFWDNRPYLDQYIRCTNRLAFGERTVIVMSSKVAQKSYGTEKRFLCPPPTAIMIGNSWWSETTRRGEEPKQAPPRVVISISGEPMPQEGSVEWTSTSGKAFDVNDPPSGTTYIGRCVGKQLYISDVDEKKKKVEALVKIMAPASDEEPERVIGVFPSRPIKVISKPSKKRQSAKNLECKLIYVRDSIFRIPTLTQPFPFLSEIILLPKSVHQSRFHHLLIPSFAQSNSIDKVLMRLRIWRILQRIRWCPAHGRRSANTYGNPIVYCPYR